MAKDVKWALYKKHRKYTAITYGWEPLYRAVLVRVFDNKVDAVLFKKAFDRINEDQGMRYEVKPKPSKKVKANQKSVKKNLTKKINKTTFKRK